MLFDEGHLFRSKAPSGPFVPADKNFVFLDQSVGVGFPRLWGEVHTGDPAVTLLTHNQLLRTTTYAALTKRVVLSADGVLRAVWWEQNELLRGESLAVVPETGGAHNATTCRELCLTSGMMLEGEMRHGSSSGIWFETQSSTNNATSGASFLFATSADSGSGIFRMGLLSSPTDNATLGTVVDRAMTVAPAQQIRFRLVVRNSWTDASMVEFYVNDVLGQAFSIGNRGAPASAAGRLTGVFATVGGASVSSAHKLTLPEQPHGLKSDDDPQGAQLAPFRSGRVKSDDTSRVPPNLNASLGLLLPAYWGGKGPTMLTTEWRRIAQFAQTLPISVVTSSCCWPAAAERAALSSLHDAGVQLLFYVPTLDPTAYKSGKIVCCDSYENITRHVDEVFAEARKQTGHTGLIKDFGIFFDVKL